MTTPHDLPLPARGIVALLLTEQGGETSALERCFHGTKWPRGVKAVVPSREEQAVLVDWFGIVGFPCVAIVSDGMLLGVEHTCTDEACARLAEHAKTCGGAREV